MSKKTVFKIILFASLFLFRGEVFSQDISSLVIFGFDVSGVLTADDGRAMSRRIFDEINSWGVLSLFEESQAESADYIIRGKLSQSRRGYSLSAETFNRETEENLVSVTEEASSIEELYQNIFDFCIKITQPIPFPNYLVGTWEASIPVEGSPLL
jgi:hypothetical protein